MTRQGGALPKSRPPRVSALGVRVARFRHWCRDNWAGVEAFFLGAAMLATAVLFMYGVMLVVIAAAAP